MVTELVPRFDFLEHELGLWPEDVPSVVQSFPLVLGLDVGSRMRPVRLFLLEDLALPQDSVTKICRAFPSLLSLDKEEHFLPALEFLEAIGVTNVAR